LDEIDREDFVRLKKTQDNKKKKKRIQQAEAAKNRGDADEFEEVAEEDVEVIPKRENFEDDASDSEEIFV